MTESLTESGQVVEVKGERAVVLMAPSNFCQSCGLCVQREGGMSLEARNKVGARVGDGVTVELEAKKVVTASLYLYVLPIVLMFIGYGLGVLVSSLTSGTSTEIIGAIGAFAFLGLGFTFVGLLGKKLKMEEWRPTIKSIQREPERRIGSSA